MKKSINTKKRSFFFLGLAYFALTFGEELQGQDWMKDIDNHYLISALTIPGTHDSATSRGVLSLENQVGDFVGGGIFGSIVGVVSDVVVGSAGRYLEDKFVKTQDESIYTQLNMGVRFLDVRCRHINNAFAIHHDKWYVQLNFSDVLNESTRFLRENPSECILMSVKEEYEEENCTQSYEETFANRYMQEAPWYCLTSGMPRLGDVRGKIVLLRRFGRPSNDSLLGFKLCLIDNDETHERMRVGYYHVQDRYKVDADVVNKFRQITQFLNGAKDGDGNDLYVNFASGVDTFKVGGDPRSISNRINSQLGDFFSSYSFSSSKARFGIIVMDFCPEYLVRQIISFNQFGIKKPARNEEEKNECCCS